MLNPLLVDLMLFPNSLYVHKLNIHEDVGSSLAPPSAIGVAPQVHAPRRVCVLTWGNGRELIRGLGSSRGSRVDCKKDDLEAEGVGC